MFPAGGVVLPGIGTVACMARLTIANPILGIGVEPSAVAAVIIGVLVNKVILDSYRARLSLG